MGQCEKMRMEVKKKSKINGKKFVNGSSSLRSTVSDYCYVNAMCSSGHKCDEII